MTNYENKYSITITFKDGYGEDLTVESPKSEGIYNKFKKYLATGQPLGFEVMNDDGSACIYLFDAVAKICRTPIERTETTTGQCKDIDICDLMNQASDEPEDGGTSAP